MIKVGQTFVRKEPYDPKMEHMYRNVVWIIKSINIKENRVLVAKVKPDPHLPWANSMTSRYVGFLDRWNSTETPSNIMKDILSNERKDAN